MLNDQLSIPNLSSRFQSLSGFWRGTSRPSSPWIPGRPVLGLEIRATALSLACVKPGFGRFQLVCSGSIPDFATLSPQQLGAKLREFLKPLNGEEPGVVLGLPRRDVIVRFLSLPTAASKSFKEAVAIQAEMYKPTDEEKFVWDTAVIDEGQRLETTLVLVPHKTIENFAKLFFEAGYPLTRLTLTQFSFFDFFFRAQHELESKRFLLLDCNDVDAELALLEGKKLVYSRSFPLPADGAKAISELLSEVQQGLSSLRWNELTAEAVLVSESVPKPMEAALAPFGPVGRLEDKIPSMGLAMPAGMQSQLGATAVALASLARGRGPYCLNLLPPESRLARPHLRYLPAYALLAANLLLLISLGLRVPVQNYVLLRQYRREIAAVKLRADEMKLLLEKNREMRQELQELDSFQHRGQQPLDALNEIAQKLPPDAWLSVFSCKRGQVELGGTAKAASPLLPLLQSSPQFQEVKFNGALSQDASGAERFRMQIRLKDKP